MSLQLNGTAGVTYNDGSNQPAAASPYGLKNLIINGNMQIAQRGTSVAGITSTTSYLTVDRFFHSITNIGTWTSSQDTDAPEGFGSSLKLECTASASLASNSLIEILQIFEGQNLQQLKKGTANAESVTISFWVKSNKIGDYVVGLLDNDNGRDRASLYTINTANTWEKKTVTFEGDITGALDNDANGSFRIRMCLGAGTNFTTGTLASTWQATVSANRAVGQVNLADSTSNYINITGVQLEIGDTATPFENRMYSTELAMCQRYFIKTNPDDLARPTFLHGLHFANNASLAALYANLPTRMRTAPSITRGGTNDNFWNPGYSASATANFNPTYTLSTPDGLFIELSSISVGANSAPIGYNGQLSLNAEL